MRRPYQNLFIVLGMLLTLSGTVFSQDKPPRVMALEYQIRERATKIVIPDFPIEAVNTGAQGIVDAIILFDDKGKTSEVKILDAAHPLLAQAMTDALKQWEVEPYIVGGQSAELYGEIRFNFKITDSVGKVEDTPAGEQRHNSKKYKDERRRIIDKMRRNANQQIQ